MKKIHSQTYNDFIKQKTHCPKCSKEQGHKNVLNPSHPSIYRCDCGNQFNPDNSPRPAVSQPPRMAQSADPLLMKLSQIKQLLDEVAGDMQVDESAREKASNWLMDFQRTISSMI